MESFPRGALVVREDVRDKGAKRDHNIMTKPGPEDENYRVVGQQPIAV